MESRPLQNNLNHCLKSGHGLDLCKISTKHTAENLSHFEPPYGSLEATYAVHLRLIGKSVVNFN